MEVKYVDLISQWKDERSELMPLIDSACLRGQYIGGSEIENFENAVAELCQINYSVALNSGTDALIFAMMSLGVSRGDEVITPPNSFIASTAAIAHLGAVPVFVDVKENQNIDPDKISRAITKKTKVIMPVHLTGRMAEMDKIKKIAEEHNLHIIEDAAQSIGSKYKGLPSGKWGKLGCFSAHPLKNLNACGDAGFVFTDDKVLADKIKLIRSHGLVSRESASEFGWVSRMDVIQAVILNYRIKKLKEIIQKRRNNANLYYELIDKSKIFIPPESPNEYNTYHTFVIQIENRDEIRRQLMERGIQTNIHYPTPIHLQPASYEYSYKEGDFPNAENQSKKILSLPIHQYLKEYQIEYVAKNLNALA